MTAAVAAGLGSVIARISDLDSRIRAVDPGWCGTGVSSAGGLAGSGGIAGTGSGSRTASSGQSGDSGFAGVLSSLTGDGTSRAASGSGGFTPVVATTGAAYRPAFVTERKTDTPWDDCTLSAAAMLADFASGGEIRPTRAALRAASGVADQAAVSDPTSLDDAARALAAAAPGVTMERPSTGLDLDWDGLMARIRSGDAAVVQGMYGALTTQERRWNPSFSGPHAMYVQAGPTADTLLVMDPLAPAGSTGEVMPASDVRAFAEALSGSDRISAGVASPGSASASAVLARFDALSSTIPYAAQIRAAAVDAGVDPLLLASVVEAESSFDPTSHSSAGAMGLMQLMPATAKALHVDDPYDPVENLEGGAKYLAGDLKIYGRVDVALAAYQAGKGAVAAAGGGIPDYPSTRAYIDRILTRWSGYLEEPVA